MKKLKKSNKKIAEDIRQLEKKFKIIFGEILDVQFELRQIRLQLDVG